jgi:hypothetical protein
VYREANAGAEQRFEKLHKRGKTDQVLQGPGFSNSEQFAQDPAQVVRRGNCRCVIPGTSGKPLCPECT